MSFASLKGQNPLFMTAYQTVIGLEVHCQLKTNTKLFSYDPYNYGQIPNTEVGPVTLALPGTLPILNQEVLKMAILAGLALNCKIASVTKFDRKHYFYPDLPKGYQISQYDKPYATQGKLILRRRLQAQKNAASSHVIESGNMSSRKNQSREKKEAATNGSEISKVIRIHRIHMEEDAGKLIHSSSGSKMQSYVDFNRAGVPLLEIVTEPDLRSADDASLFLQTLRTILCSIDVTDGNMEEGSLRCDANISLRKKEDDPLGTRVEIKNLNSFKAVRSALLYEQERQEVLLDSGKMVEQSTVLWDADQRKTRLMRTKDDAEDYRYFPEPDLLPIKINSDFVKEVEECMPELPEDKYKRYRTDFALPEYDAELLARDKETSAYFEKVYEVSDDPKKSSNWVKDEVLGVLNKNQTPLSEFLCGPERLGRMIRLLNDGKITGKLAKQIFEHMYTENLDPEDVMEKYGYKPLGSSELETVVERVMQNHQDKVEEIRNGKDRIKGYLIGQVMKETNGQAPPKEVGEMIDQKISQPS